MCVMFWILLSVCIYNRIRLKCLKSEAEYRIEMILYSILTSYFIFVWFLSFFSSVDIWCCNVGKKENVKSCIIYEICIKEICNSIINKILIQFLEPVVQLRILSFFFFLLYLKVINGDITDIYKKQHFKVMTTSICSPWPPALPVQDILRDRPVWINCSIHKVHGETWLQLNAQCLRFSGALLTEHGRYVI